MVRSAAAAYRHGVAAQATEESVLKKVRARRGVYGAEDKDGSCGVVQHSRGRTSPPELAALPWLCSGVAKGIPAMPPTEWPHTRADHRLSAREVAVKSLRFLRLNRLVARL